MQILFMKNIFNFLLVSFFLSANLISASSKNDVISTELFKGNTSKTVLATSITVNESLNTFNACLGSVSLSQTFTVSGSELSSDIVIDAPTGYEISNDGGTSWSTTLTLPQTAGSVPTTTISIRIAATTTSVSNNLIILISSGSTINNISNVDGSINFNLINNTTLIINLLKTCF